MRSAMNTWLMLVLLAAGAAAQTPAQDWRAAGRTIFVEEATAGRYPADPIVAALKKWGRFPLAATREQADLVLTLNTDDPGGALDLPASSRDRKSPPVVFRVDVTERATGARLWTGTRNAGFRYNATAQKLVEDFRKTVEKAKR